MAANLSSLLMTDLDVVRGKQAPYATPGGYRACTHARTHRLH